MFKVHLWKKTISFFLKIGITWKTWRERKKNNSLTKRSSLGRGIYNIHSCHETIFFFFFYKGPVIGEGISLKQGWKVTFAAAINSQCFYIIWLAPQCCTPYNINEHLIWNNVNYSTDQDKKKNLNIICRSIIHFPFWSFLYLSSKKNPILDLD